MFGSIRRTLPLAAVCLPLLVGGLACSRDDKPPAANANAVGKDGQGQQEPRAEPAAAVQSGAEPAPREVIPRESLNWTKAEAASRLLHEESGVAAAVRLARLARIRTAGLPEPLTRSQASRLRLVRVGDDLFALGVPDEGLARTYRWVVLLNAAGDPVAPGGGPAEVPAQEPAEPESFATDVSQPGRPAPAAPVKPVDGRALPRDFGDWTLYASEDADVFPRLLISVDRVVDAADVQATMLMLQSAKGLRFDIRLERSYPYVALLTTTPEQEVARYKWDPYELSFMGPLRDKLPDGSGSFALDLEASAALQPVGGEISQGPIENKPPPQPGQADEEDAPPY